MSVKGIAAPGVDPDIIATKEIVVPKFVMLEKRPQNEQDDFRTMIVDIVFEERQTWETGIQNHKAKDRLRNWMLIDHKEKNERDEFNAMINNIASAAKSAWGVKPADNEILAKMKKWMEMD